MVKTIPHTNDISREDDNTGLLQWIARSILPAAFPVFRNAEINACFYPYIGLTHTIRRKGSAWTIRISDHCRRAPKSVLESIVVILASKIAHRKPSQKYVDLYERYRKDPAVEESVRQRRLARGRKHIAPEVGQFHSLHDIYEEVNSRFFNNQIEISRIGWGLRRSWSRLGHYDPVHHTITVSPVLDAPGVPGYVVGYIVYHEMLHELFEGSGPHGVRRHHPPEFRRAERAYPDFANARKFLSEYCSRRRKRRGSR